MECEVEHFAIDQPIRAGQQFQLAAAGKRRCACDRKDAGRFGDQRRIDGAFLKRLQRHRLADNLKGDQLRKLARAELRILDIAQPHEQQQIVPDEIRAKTESLRTRVHADQGGGGIRGRPFRRPEASPNRASATSVTLATPNKAGSIRPNGAGLPLTPGSSGVRVSRKIFSSCKPAKNSGGSKSSGGWASSVQASGETATLLPTSSRPAWPVWPGRPFPSVPAAPPAAETSS